MIDNVHEMIFSETRTPAGAKLLVPVLVLLCLLAYARSLSIPLIEDDYPNITQAQIYGPLSGAPAMFREGVFRLRATSYWIMFALWQSFGLTAQAYHLTSLLIHVINTLLVYGIARAWLPMRAGAFCAAAFFAVQEGHQEAVMWFSAINELLLFLFGAGALFCWLLASRSAKPWPLHLAAWVLFALALISKESAIILLPLFVLVTPRADWRRSLPAFLPYCALALLAVASVAATRDYSFRFSDGSFSLSAPFWITWPRSIFRLLWIWGLVAAAIVVKERKLRGPALLALAWMGVALLPYSFLTYSTQIPSRQTYLASAGLCLLFGLAVAHLPRRMAAALLLVVVLQSVGYLWVRKHRQFLERAEPTEQLIALARRTPGPIWVRCFPRPWIIAQEAVRLAAGRPSSALIWTDSDAAIRKPAAEFRGKGCQTPLLPE